MPKFLTKVAKIFGHFLGYFDKLWISSKSALGTFRATFTTSGHTGLSFKITNDLLLR